MQPATKMRQLGIGSQNNPFLRMHSSNHEQYPLIGYQLILLKYIDVVKAWSVSKTRAKISSCSRAIIALHFLYRAQLKVNIQNELVANHRAHYSVRPPHACPAHAASHQADFHTCHFVSSEQSLTVHKVMGVGICRVVCSTGRWCRPFGGGGATYSCLCM